MISRTVAAIVSAIATYNSDNNLGLRTVQEHAGAFTWQEFQNRTYNNPAAFITNLGWRELKANEDARVHDIRTLYAARFAVAIITQNATNAELRNQQGRLLCEHLCRFLEDFVPPLDHLSEPFDIKVDPRFMAVVNDDGQALWLLEWWHHLPMYPEALSELDDFEGADIDHANAENPNQILAETTVNL